MKAVVAAFNQEKALVGAFSVITNLRMELFEALLRTAPAPGQLRSLFIVKMLGNYYPGVTMELPSASWEADHQLFKWYRHNPGI